MRTVAIGLFALLWAAGVNAADQQSSRRLSNDAACRVLIDAFPAGALRSEETTPGADPWFDDASALDNLYAIFGLHSNRRCDYICSTPDRDTPCTFKPYRSRSR